MNANAKLSTGELVCFTLVFTNFFGPDHSLGFLVYLPWSMHSLFCMYDVNLVYSPMETTPIANVPSVTNVVKHQIVCFVCLKGKATKGS